jgi:hypothetical protein
MSESINIEAFLYSKYDIVLAKNGEELRIDCPFCGDHSHHLYFSIEKGVCHCFKCEYAASTINFVKEVTGLSYKEIFTDLGSSDIVPLYQLLSRHSPIIIPLPGLDMPDNYMPLPDALNILPGINRHNAIMALTYIKSRIVGIDGADYPHYEVDIISRCGIWAGEEGFGKVVFPVENNWWQYRNILRYHTGPKYVSCDKPKGDVLYNSSALDIHKSVYIAEGIISSWHLGRNAVALCGKKATPEQLDRLIKASVEEYIVCLDHDALEQAIELADALYKNGKLVMIRRYSQGDPAEDTVWEDIPYDGFSAKIGLGFMVYDESSPMDWDKLKTLFNDRK